MTNRDDFEIVERTRRKARKKREAALLLPLLGVFFLVTPVVGAFTLVNGLPNATHMIFYVFGVWAILIVAAKILAQLLRSEISNE